MDIRHAIAFACSILVPGSVHAQGDGRTWVDMSTGTSSKVFVDTASIDHSDGVTANVVIIGSSTRQELRFDFDCPTNRYRADGGDWQSDDPDNVRRICDRDFRGLDRHTQAEVSAVSVYQRQTRRLTTAPGKWILVDWNIDGMVLVEPASIVEDPRGWRFRAIVHQSGSERVQAEMVADCVEKKVLNETQQKLDRQAIKDDLFGGMLRQVARNMNRSALDVMIYVAFCHERPVQFHDAPGIDLTEALSARDQFEVDRTRYLRANPGADVSKAINLAPGPRELGGYQLSLIDILMPAGFRSEIVGVEQARTVVRQTWKHPFSSVGRLLVRAEDWEGHCSATLIGNNRTILTAKHCAIRGGEFRFAPGNSPWENAIPATTVAAGDFDLRREGPWVRTEYDSAPNADWDDWMVLDLGRPAPGEPLVVPEHQFIEDTVDRFHYPYFHVVGFPGDVKEGNEMIYSRGCGAQISEGDFKGARTSKTGCASYRGSSGSALLVLTPELRYVPVGVLTSGSYTDTSFSILTVGGRAFDAIRAKVASECQSSPPGVRFHPQACPS